jgi:hypothetical protein
MRFQDEPQLDIAFGDDVQESVDVALRIDQNALPVMA